MGIRDYDFILCWSSRMSKSLVTNPIAILTLSRTRRLFGQGLKLETEPFFERVEILLEHSSGSDAAGSSPTYLRTVLIQNNGRGSLSLR
jgi:hypothetical protein